jgi:hypothetical protein
MKLRNDPLVEFFKPFQIGFIGERDIDKVGGGIRLFPINTRNIGPYKKGIIVVLYFTKKMIIVHLNRVANGKMFDLIVV